MKCPHCNTNNPSGNQICSKCGASLVKVRHKNKQKKAKKTAKKYLIRFAPGDNFGKRFEIIELIRLDGMGRIYKAWDKKLNRNVALGMFDPGLEAESWITFMESIKQELPKENFKGSGSLANIYETGNVGNIKYISIPFVERRIAKIFKKQIISFSAVAIILIGIIIVFSMVKKQSVGFSPVIRKEKSIAVLPFQDFSPRQEQEYLCDGMTEAIIEKLSQIAKLKVISITSVMHYKNTTKDIKEIGEELGVATILKGTIEKEKSRIRVRAQLINVEDGSNLWSDSYYRKLENIFEIQDETSRAIAKALKLELTLNRLAVLKTREPIDVKAYESYLKGGYFIEKKYSLSGEEEDFTSAVRLFENAIEIDPNYALAYWGLGTAYESYYVATKNKKARNLMFKNFKKAYKINPKLAEANLAMGWTHFDRGDLDKAHHSFRRALELDPNKLMINIDTGSFLGSIGLYHQAIEYYSRCLESDPLLIWLYLYLVDFYMYTGEFDKTAHYIEAGLKVEPGNVPLLIKRARYLIWTNKYDEAERILDIARRIEPGNYDNRITRALLLAAKGEKEEALDLIKGITPYLREVTSIYSLVGMNDEAIKYINRGIHTSLKSDMVYLYSYPFLTNNPCYDNLRDDPRFQEIVKKEKKKYEEKLKKYSDL